jgi:hypothetical protein
MRESTAVGSAPLSGAAIGLFGWDLARLGRVDTARSMHLAPRLVNDVIESSLHRRG